LQDRPDQSPPVQVFGQLASLSPESVAAASTMVALSRGQASGPRPGQILVIEDDPIHRELIARIVEKAGFEAHTAGDGEEGWAALCRARYDLAIIDHELPKLSGTKLIMRLREVSAKPPCILISVKLPAPVSVLTKAVYPGAVMEKPFLIPDLVETIFVLLGS
jgi:DNA-binding response OmpR family regulator